MCYVRGARIASNHVIDRRCYAHCMRNAHVAKSIVHIAHRMLRRKPMR